MCGALLDLVTGTQEHSEQSLTTLDLLQLREEIYSRVQSEDHLLLTLQVKW